MKYSNPIAEGRGKSMKVRVDFINEFSQQGSLKKYQVEGPAKRTTKRVKKKELCPPTGSHLYTYMIYLIAAPSRVTFPYLGLVVPDMKINAKIVILAMR